MRIAAKDGLSAKEQIGRRRIAFQHQQYSTVNQSVAILQRAEQHNMEIVRTYSDHEKRP